MFLLCHLPATPGLSKLSAFCRVQSKHCCCLVSESCLTFSAPWTVAHQAPLSGISQARILEWLLFASPGDLPDSGIEPESPALAGRFFTIEPPGKATSETLLPLKSLPISADRSRSPLCVSPKSPAFSSYKVLIPHSFSCLGECLHALSGYEL